MSGKRLYIVMVGLPARGKSTVATRISQALAYEGIKVKVFNNGELRRRFVGRESSMPDFYRPDNRDGKNKREQFAVINARAAKTFLNEGGNVAILDATNGSVSRRKFLRSVLDDAPVLFLECVNNDPELIAASVDCKAQLPEFSRLSHEHAVDLFMERISYYERIFESPRDDGNYIRVDTLHNMILEEKVDAALPFYLRIRDILVTSWIRELYLARHGESRFNIEGRIGGDAPLTSLGMAQAGALADEFERKFIPYIFISKRRRSRQTAEPLLARHSEASIIEIPELDEIDAGICDSMRYEDIRQDMPDVYQARKLDKYNYCYPSGESYASMLARVERGFLKALFLAGGQPGCVVIGHQAVNRSILSLFLYRRKEDVPYIFIPQDQYFKIVATHREKSIELVRFAATVK